MAFVTAATTAQLHVFDASTRASLSTIDVFGKDPRALATSADGSKVYAVIQRSGNGTTILPAQLAPPPPPPTNITLPPAPQQGLIIRADDPQWSNQIPHSLPDHDVVEVDVVTQFVAWHFRFVVKLKNLSADPSTVGVVRNQISDE